MFFAPVAMPVRVRASSELYNQILGHQKPKAKSLNRQAHEEPSSSKTKWQGPGLVGKYFHHTPAARMGSPVNEANGSTWIRAARIGDDNALCMPGFLSSPVPYLSCLNHSYIGHEFE